MLTAEFRPGTLVILSGAPGSGKSSLAAQYPEHVVSSDNLRATFFGYQNELIEERPTFYLYGVDSRASERPRNLDDGFIFETLEKIVDVRMKNGMTTIVDATSPTDTDRHKFAKIAEKYGRPVLICIMDVPKETLYKRNASRKFPVSNSVVDRFVDKLELTSHWPYILNPELLNVNYWTIQADQPLDIIGDIHGCVEVINLVERLGYMHGVHPQGRKLLFLGDMVDRGPHSLKVLEFVMGLVSQGHYCVLANHEANLLKGLKGEEVRSHATRRTLHEVLLSGKQKEIQKFIEERPPFYLYGVDTLICHADTTSFYTSTLKEAVYGTSTLSRAVDSDAVFATHYPNRKLIRGHIAATSPQHNVFALEEGAGYSAGSIVACRASIGGNSLEFFREPTTFVYKDLPKTFEQRMEPLVKTKLVNVDKCGPLKLFKYSSKAFYNPETFAENPNLGLARTVVTGLDGEPIGTTFPKIYNYGEKEAPEIDLNEEIIWVEKLNGFFAQVFLDPYSVKPKLIYTSSGKFTGEFAEMARQNIQQYSGAIIRLFKTSNVKNLMFEIVDARDPHIVDYSKEEYGAYLIGAGYKNGLASEHVLDYMSLSLDELRRPYHGRATYREVLEKTKACDREGYMVRSLTGEHLVKLKSPTYLAIKFISRMSHESDTVMFRNPTVTKQKIRARGLEELQFVVDIIVEQLTEEAWKAMNSIERRDYLIPLVKSHYAYA
jgi:predicted kinase